MGAVEDFSPKRSQIWLRFSFVSKKQKGNLKIMIQLTKLVKIGTAAGWKDTAGLRIKTHNNI